MSIILRNNIAGTLATTISASDVGIVLDSGQGDRFPGLNPGEYFYATLAGIDGSVEIVKVTDRVGDTLQVERAADDSTAASFADGSRIEMRINAACLRDLINEDLSVTPAYPDFAGNAGKVLTVNITEDGVEWTTIVTAAPELPDTAGNAGKVLVVNPGGDGVLWEELPTAPRVFGTGIEAPSADSEVLLRFASDVTGQITANLSDWRVVPDGVATGTDYVMALQKNGVGVGTITISTAGAVTVATSGGLAVSIAAGDVIKIVAPADAATTGAALSFAITGKVVI